jgi:hypothetical protein
MALAKGLAVNSTLQTLRMNGNDIGDDGGVALAGQLMVNRSLEEIHLDENGMEDRAIMLFSRALKTNPKIKLLSLATNPGVWRSDGAFHLACAMAESPWHRRIHLPNVWLWEQTKNIEEFPPGFVCEDNDQFLEFCFQRFLQCSVAFHMAFHPRLGKDSPASVLSDNQDAMELVFHHHWAPLPNPLPDVVKWEKDRNRAFEIARQHLASQSPEVLARLVAQHRAEGPQAVARAIMASNGTQLIQQAMSTPAGQQGH